MKISFLEKFGAAVLIVIWLLYGSNWIANTMIPAGDTAMAAANSTATKKAETAKPRPAAKAPAAAATDGGDLAANLRATDALSGEKVFKKCKACHAIDTSGKHKIGPNLWEVVGRTQAGAAGFKYSTAFKALGGKWGYSELDAFLTKPKVYAKGTKMQFAGLKKAKDRAAVILYLRAHSESPLPLP